MVYCRRCGTHLNDGEIFCPKCGTLYRDYTSINPNKKEITIGRSTSCDISLGQNCDFASTYHGTIFWNGTQLMYKDTSSNGTVINNMMVHSKTVPINHGDTVLIAGKYQITWEKIDSLLAPPKMPYQPTRLLKLNTVTSCRKCGTRLNEGAKFCPKCGTPCKSSFSQFAGESGVVGQKKSSKVLIKALLSVILVIALTAGGWFVWKNYENDYSLEGLAVALPNYEEVFDFHEGLARVEKNGKWGYIDKTGNEVIPCIYDNAFDFHERLAKVQKNGKWGYIDKTGKEVIPCIYVAVSYDFHEGLAWVRKNEKYGFIDETGMEVIPFIYDGASDFYEGLAWVRKNGYCGFIDKTGKEIIPCIYDDASDFHEGLAKVEKNGEWGYIDKTGKKVVPCIYDNGADVHEGLAWVRKNEYCGFIDKTGKEIIPCIYDNICYEFHEGLAWVRKDGKGSYINKTGREVIPCIYDSGADFHEGLARVEKNGKWGYIDKTGKEVIPCIYDEYDKAPLGMLSRETFNFHEGLACVEKNGKCGIIDKTGKEVIPCIYDEAFNFHEGLAIVKKDGVHGAVDRKGNSTFDVENVKVKQMVQLKIKEKEEEEERERILIEEENKPCNRFYSLASQNQFVWEARKHKFDVPGIDVLYFYPISKTEGYVSITRHEPDYNGWYPTHSTKTNYRIIGDNSISFSASGVGGLRRLPWSTNYNMSIEKDGNEIRLVNHHNYYGDSYDIIYTQKKKPIEDPLSE